MDHTYRISLCLGDSSFEIESTDKAWLEAKEKQYLFKMNLPSVSPSRPPGVHRTEKEEVFSPNLSINEFYKKYVKANNVKSRPDMAVFFTYYLGKILKKDVIKTADVADCFAKIAYPGYNKLNMTDNLSKAKRKAFLNYVNNSWSLTTTGEDFVANIIATSTK